GLDLELVVGLADGKGTPLLEEVNQHGAGAVRGAVLGDDDREVAVLVETGEQAGEGLHATPGRADHCEAPRPLAHPLTPLSGRSSPDGRAPGRPQRGS